MLDVGLLGPLEVRRDGRVIDLGRTKAAELLALLVAASPAAVSTARLADDLWDGDPPPSAPKLLQKQVSVLRRLLGADAVRSTPAGYALGPVTTDLDRFRDAVHRAQSRPAGGEAAVLREALAGWRGEPFAGLALDRLHADRRRLEAARWDAEDRLAELDVAMGRGAEAVGALEQRVAEHPQRERAWVALVDALHRAGRRADALEVYQRARAALQAELGRAPSAALQAVERSALAAEPFSADRPAPTPARTRGPFALVAAEVDSSEVTDPEDLAQLVRQLEQRVAAWTAELDGRVVRVMSTDVLAVFEGSAASPRERAVAFAERFVGAFARARACVVTASTDPAREPADTGSDDVDQAFRSLAALSWGEVKVLCDEALPRSTSPAVPPRPAG